ncbi:MAG: hypothetical protein ACREOV_00225 [Candidatus Dormibacteraceae bacterium]
MTRGRLFLHPFARLRRVGAVVVLPLLALVALSSCGVQLIPFLPESTSQLASTAASSWNGEAAHRFQGTFTASGTTARVDVVLTVSGVGNGLGSGKADGATFQYLELAQKPYLKGQAFWQAYFSGQSSQQTLANGFQNNWTVAGENNVALAIRALPNLSGLVPQLSADSHSVKKGGTRTIDGQQATALTENGTTWWVTGGSGGRLVGLQASSAGGLHEVDLTMATGAAPSGLQSQLGTPVDPNNASTLPAYYQYQDQTEADPGNCNQDQCAIDVTILNAGGTPAGPAVVTVNAYTDQTKSQLIASCTAPIPSTIASSQTGTASCTLSGPGWSAFTGSEFYVYPAVTQNPPYV